MQVHLLSEGSPNQTSGGYLYNRHLMSYLRDAGIAVTYHSGPEALGSIEPRSVLVADSLVVAPLADCLLDVRASLVLLLHTVPDLRSLQGRRAASLEALYRRARIVVTGEASLADLRAQMPRRELDLVKIEPGVPAEWRAKHGYTATARRLVCVANYIRGKGVSRLLDVLRQLTALPWTMNVFGNWQLDPEFSGALLEKLHRFGLAGRVRLSGPIPHAVINAHMVRSDLLVHFSRHESYSMVTAEAIASGLPVLSYPVGNATEFRRSGLVRHVEHDGASDVVALRDLIVDRRAYGALRPLGALTKRTNEHLGQEFLEFLKRA